MNQLAVGVFINRLLKLLKSIMVFLLLFKRKWRTTKVNTSSGFCIIKPVVFNSKKRIIIICNQFWHFHEQAHAPVSLQVSPGTCSRPVRWCIGFTEDGSAAISWRHARTPIAGCRFCERWAEAGSGQKVCSPFPFRTRLWGAKQPQEDSVMCFHSWRSTLASCLTRCHFTYRKTAQ